ncbi:hypothetical protein POM88_037018 [Heracleum sosnowskyi]|uniref:Uncharacterized protein n=1 Tax=Heracleum sosnowskyi TaxID=360622 RepID=A0AAD8HPK1_9APIA|nr:hypothetical protein POM88_037018 [Heracleum sosnowskyi]
MIVDQGKLQISLEYVQREFNHVKCDGELAGWVLLVDFFMVDQLTSQIPLMRHLETTWLDVSTELKDKSISYGCKTDLGVRGSSKNLKFHLRKLSEITRDVN